MTASERLANAVQERLLPVATAKRLRLGISESRGFGEARSALRRRLTRMPRWWLFALSLLAFGMPKGEDR